ncbi:MAG: tetratricopeptide repeat protein [Bacteroidetes bacterium]|nr:tetratricopeptide repeat protein [Bacteroidota bacterium]
MSAQTKSIRIFISSPGDVAEERTLTRKVIERLQGEYSGLVTLEPIYWEHEPLRATQSFQEQITRPSETDIVITILWSRLGTRLPAQFKKPDGSRYESGTEFEFEDAFESFKKHGTPDLLIYRKTADPQVSLKDKDVLLDKIKQKEALDSFFDRWFHDTTEGTLIAAFHPFDNSADFEEIFEAHLSKLIKMRLPEAKDRDKVPAIKPVWKEGSPYRGLSVFNFEHAPVFFGRTKAVSEIIDSLRIQQSVDKAFILILGMSGGGKSSLVRAGVLPMITQPGVIEGVGIWRRAIMKPGDASGDLFDGLAYSLLQQEALPELSADGTSIKELAKLLRETPKAIVPLIKGGLSQAASEVERKEKLEKQPIAKLVLVVDQMEEMFSLERITHKERKLFVEALDALSRSGRVWVIATLRSDFYPRTSELDTLVALKEGNGQYDLLTPTTAEIGQMIRQPAQAAGLFFEEDKSTNEKLDDVLRDAAAKNPGALPLLEFTLEELYKRRTDDGMLTYDAYRKLGGVEGALAQRAEEVFSGLDAEVKKAMDVELHSLISIGADERISRKYAPLEQLTATPETKAFVEAFVESRLFITDLATDGSAVVHIAHEALLQHWPRLSAWIEKNKEDLRIHTRVTIASTRWEKENRSREFLYSASKQVSEAEELIKNKSIELTEAERSFVKASIAKRRRIWWMKRAIVAALVVLSLIATGTAYIAQQERDRAKIEANTAEQVSDFLVGLFEVSDPSEALGDTITAREILDKGAEKIENELSDQQEVQSRLMTTMAKVYQNLGLYDVAQPMYEKALEKKRELFGESSIEYAVSLNDLGMVYYDKGVYDTAEALFLNSIAITNDILGCNDTILAMHLLNLGQLKVETGQYEEADSLFSESLRIVNIYFDEENPKTIGVLHSIAGVKTELGDLEEAEMLFMKVVNSSRSIYGEKHPDYILYLGTLAQLHHRMGKLSSADSMFRITIRLSREIYGDAHPDLATRLNNLGMVLHDEGQYEEAEECLKEALAIAKKVYGEEHPRVASGLNNMGYFLARKGDVQGAEFYFNEALEMQRRIFGNLHPSVALSLANLGYVLNAQGAYLKAEELYRESLAINRQIYGNEHPSVAANLVNLATIMRKSGNEELVEDMFLEALTIQRNTLGDEHPKLATSLNNIAGLYKEKGDYIKAEEYYKEALEIQESNLPEGHWLTAVTMNNYGECLIKLERYREAESLITASYPILKEKRGHDDTYTLKALDNLINLYTVWKKPEKVKEYEAYLNDTTNTSN